MKCRAAVTRRITLVTLVFLPYFLRAECRMCTLQDKAWPGVPPPLAAGAAAVEQAGHCVHSCPPKNHLHEVL